jgi:uncharacterized protein
MMTGADFFIFRLRPHEDLKKQIFQVVQEKNISAGIVVSCVGSLEQYNLRFANQPGGTLQQGFHEILSLTGTVSINGLHLHMTVADAEGKVTGGHLLQDNFIYTTAEITLAIFRDIIFTREHDPTYGYLELVIQKNRGDEISS